MVHKYNCYIIGCILGSPITTSERVINLVTNVRRENKNDKQIDKGKTGDIDVRHWEGF